MTLNEFIAAGSDFFKGNTIAKAEHERIVAETKSATASEVKTLTENVATLTEQLNAATVELERFKASNAQLTSELSAAVAKVAQIPAAASAAAATIVATVGATTPVAQTITETAGANVSKGFAALVAEYQAQKNVSKPQAIAACVTLYPTEHLAWKQAGGSKL